MSALSLSKNPRVDKGPQPLMFKPALTTWASERMKTQRFSYFADFAARERMREAKPVKLKKAAFAVFLIQQRFAAALVYYVPASILHGYRKTVFEITGLGVPVVDFKLAVGVYIAP